MKLASSRLRTPSRVGVLLFSLGFVLRLVSAVWPESFWFDEMITLYFARLPVAESFFIDNHPPTFFLLLKAWVWLIGNIDSNSEPILRLLPFLISVAGLAAVFCGWKSWGVRIAMTLNPASIFFASEVRHHSLFELTTVLFILQATRVWTKRNEPIQNFEIWLLALAALALLSSHFLGVVLILSFLFLLTLSTFSQKKSWLQISIYVFAMFAVCCLGWILENYWIRAEYLDWLTQFHDGSLWVLLKEPLLVVGSYSRLWTLLSVGALLAIALRGQTSARFYSQWFLAFFICTVATEIVFNRSLGFRKFMIPGHVLASVALGLGAIDFFRSQPKKLFRVFVSIALIFGFGITVKKIGEDLVGLRSGWKTVMKRECENRTLPILVWGHPSFDFYFSPACALISNNVIPGTWYVSRDLSKYLISNQSFEFELLEVIEEKALEPIHKYEAKSIH